MLRKICKDFIFIFKRELCSTYDLFNYEIPTSEEVPLCISDVKHPRWTYAMTKMHGESAFIHCSKAYSMNAPLLDIKVLLVDMGLGMQFLMRGL